MDLREIADKRNIKVKELDVISDKIKSEKRKMNEEETLNYNSIKEEVESLTKQIDDINEADKKVVRSEINIKNNEKIMNKFSLRKAIVDAMYGSLSEESLEYVDKITDRHGFSMPIENRATIASDTSDATGGYAVSKDYWNILEPLMANVAVTQMGAQFLTGLKGDLIVPTYAGTTSNWKGEVTAAADGAGAFGQVTYTPKKLTCMYVVSKQFLIQDTVNAEQMLRNNAIASIAGKLDSTILGNHVHSADYPDGFFTTGWTFAFNSAITYDKVVQLETTINNSSALKGNLGYIIHPTSKGSLKTTQRFSGWGAGILDGNLLNGYKCVDTSNIASTLSTGIGVTGGTQKGIVFGNWGDFIVAQFGALDISVNPWIYDAEGLVRITLTGYFDAKPLRSESFAVGAIA